MQTKSKTEQTNEPEEQTATKNCFVTRKKYPRQEMLRFVADPEGTVVFDASAKLPGRGVWLSSSRSVLEKAVSKKMFCKALKQNVVVPTSLPDDVQKLMRDRCLSLMSICRKAGILVFGYEAVKKVVGVGEALAAFEATDASERGQSKIFRPTDSFPLFSLFSRAELGHLVGLTEAVHVALLKGRIADETVAMARKISLFEKNGQERKDKK